LAVKGPTVRRQGGTGFKEGRKNEERSSNGGQRLGLAVEGPRVLRRRRGVVEGFYKGFKENRNDELQSAEVL
jgi:hypothetical protein